MRNSIQKLFLGLSLFITPIVFSGCVGLLVGAAAGVGGYAWFNGDLQKEIDLPAWKLHEIAVKALKRLDVQIKEENHDRLSGKILGEFADGAGVTITTSALTERKARLTIRVGIFGDKTKSEMILSTIQKYF